MNKIERYSRIASVLARESAIGYRIAIEFDTKEEKQEYIKEHDVRPTTKLDIKKTDSGSGQSQGEEEKSHPKLKSRIVKYPNLRRISKKELETALSTGYYSIISGGRNGTDEKEEKMSPEDEVFKKRHEDLQSDLEDLDLKYCEVIGQYGGKERSFLVLHDQHETVKPDGFMVHFDNKPQADKMRNKLDELGEKYNQNSVLHGDAGNNYLRFTTGKNKGTKCGGSGWNYAPKEKDFYTKINLKDQKHTKFQMDIFKGYGDTESCGKYM